MRNTSSTVNGIHRWCCRDCVTIATVPFTAIAPAVGRTRAATVESNVVLPLPLEPTSATAAPRARRNEVGARATVDP